MKPRKLIQTTLVPIRWGDMDAFGHINNTVYFRYMEQARADWLVSIGYSINRTQQESPVIINASCTFLRPLAYPGTAEVRMYVEPAGRSSIETIYEIRLKDQEQLYANGAAKMVWMNPTLGKSVPLPEMIRKISEAP